MMTTNAVSHALFMQSISVSPEKFMAVMQKILSDYDELLRESSSNNKKYSDVWGAKSGSESKIYEDIAQTLEMRWMPEYREIDAAYYKEKCPFVLDEDSYRERAKILSVAIEHENVANFTGTEMNKLLTFTALLKVLVTYPEKEKDEERLFHGYKEQIDVVDEAIPGFSANQKIMVIFGYDGKPLKWRYYLYHPTSGKFRLLD